MLYRVEINLECKAIDVSIAASSELERVLRLKYPARLLTALQ
jgi:hypothetical protein